MNDNWTRREILGSAAVIGAAVGNAGLVAAAEPVVPAAPRPAGASDPARSPFLQGPYEPLSNEQIVIDDLRVEGRIPPELSGTLYRTGTNQRFEPLDPSRFHWFDGDGMVHAFRLKDGKASYRNRLVETEGLTVERAAGKALYNGIYGQSDKPQLPLPAGAPKIKVVAGVNVIRLGKRVLALHEAGPHYWELEPTTLETLGRFNFDGQVDGMLTAHPHFDFAGNEWLLYALNNEKKFLECFAADPGSGAVKSKHRVAMPSTPWNHDFIFTPQHYIFFFTPLQWRPWADDRIPQGKSSWFVNPKEGRNNTILFVDRRTGKATWLRPEDSQYRLGHFLNAYQDGEDTIIDSGLVAPDPASPRPSFSLVPQLDGASAYGPSQIWRFTINLKKGSIKYRRIGDFSGEFARPNETLLGQKYRYAYMPAAHLPAPGTRGFNCLAKHDHATGETRFQHPAGRKDLIAGESVFVPHPRAESEDHGWVLALWQDPRRNVSELIILDARAFDGEPAARVKLDHHVPLDFHGNWIPDRIA